MQTVNFHCPHCGNLMAVGTNLLGRNVRCPHCKQVVRAPAAAGEPPGVQGPAPQAPPLTPAPPPQFRVPAPTEHHESIFGERHDEDLFGSEPLKPTLPTPAASPPPVVPETAYAPPPASPPPPAPPSQPQYSETQSYHPAAASPGLDFGDPGELAPPPEEPAPEPGYRATGPRVEAPGTPAFAWILLAYSVVITVVAGVLAYQYFAGEPKGDHPFKAIPDFYGKYEKATGPENRKQLSYKGLPDPKLDVPSDLRVKLGEEITVGAIQVRPMAVTQQAVELARENVAGDAQPRAAGMGLILTLHVKNVSTDTTFHPDDPAFNRAPAADQPLPYTALQIGREFFYGPFTWPLDRDIKDAFLTGYRPVPDPLGPGEERDLTIPVAPSGLRVAGAGSATEALKAAREKNENPSLVWRVQLRRGLVKAVAEDGRDVDVSATTVIGVEFRRDQIK